MDKIVCIGKNYADHVAEMQKISGDNPPENKTEKPVLFLKPPSSLITLSSSIIQNVKLPFDRGEIHYECELVLRLKSGGYKLSPLAARDAIDAYALGLDLTFRDLQTKLKKNGHPWEISKVFPGSAIVAEFHSIKNSSELNALEFSFWMEGAEKPLQSALSSQMILKPYECVAYASEFFELCPGDLVFTGTPAGVGKLQKDMRYFGKIGENTQWNLNFKMLESV